MNLSASAPTTQKQYEHRYRIQHLNTVIDVWFATHINRVNTVLLLLNNTNAIQQATPFTIQQIRRMPRSVGGFYSRVVAHHEYATLLIVAGVVSKYIMRCDSRLHCYNAGLKQLTIVIYFALLLLKRCV